MRIGPRGIASALAVGLFGGSVLAPCRQGGNKNRRWLDQHLIYKGNIWCCTMVYSLSGILWFMDMIWGWATTYDIRLLGEWTCICKSFHFGVNMCEQQGTRVLTYIYFYRYNIYISSYCAYCVVLAPSRNGYCWVWNMLKNLKDAFSVTNRTLNSAFPAPKLANLMHPAMLIPTWGRIAFLKQQHGFFPVFQLTWWILPEVQKLLRFLSSTFHQMLPVWQPFHPSALELW